jgi:SAM-dependent methyltransferase
MNASEEEIAAAKAYEQLHVPALFEQWAPVVLDAATPNEGDRVLDVACGTGVLARNAKSRLGGACSVTGLDAAKGMLTIARSLDPSIDWRQGLAESLPFDDAEFEVVVSQFGLMFFQDQPGAIREMLRVLAPGGRLAVAVWDSLNNAEAYPLEVDLLERTAGSDAADALRAPFALGDKTQLVEMFSLADAASITISTRDGMARFPSIRSMVEADLRGWLPVMGVSLSDDLIESILEEAEEVLADYVTETGTVEFTSPAHIVTATKRI